MSTEIIRYIDRNISVSVLKWKFGKFTDFFLQDGVFCNSIMCCGGLVGKESGSEVQEDVSLNPGRCRIFSQKLVFELEIIR